MTNSSELMYILFHIIISFVLRQHYIHSISICQEYNTLHSPCSKMQLQLLTLWSILKNKMQTLTNTVPILHKPQSLVNTILLSAFLTSTCKSDASEADFLCLPYLT